MQGSIDRSVPHQDRHASGDMHGWLGVAIREYGCVSRQVPGWLGPGGLSGGADRVPSDGRPVPVPGRRNSAP